MSTYLVIRIGHHVVGRTDERKISYDDGLRCLCTYMRQPSLALCLYSVDVRCVSHRPFVFLRGFFHHACPATAITFLFRLALRRPPPLSLSENSTGVIGHEQSFPPNFSFRSACCIFRYARNCSLVVVVRITLMSCRMDSTGLCSMGKEKRLVTM